MGHAVQIKKIPYWAFGLLTLVLIVLTFYIVARLHIPVDGAGSVSDNHLCVITVVKENSPASVAGLAKGDLLINIDGQPVSENGHFYLVNQHRAGETLEYNVIRNGHEMTFDVTLRSLWSLNPWFYVGLYTLILVVCTTSLFILSKRPYDKASRIFFIYLQLFAIAQNFRFLYLDDGYAIIATVAFIFSFNLAGVVLTQFYLHFPQPVPFLKKIKPILRSGYILGMVFSFILTIFLILRNFDITKSAENTFNVLSRWSALFMAFTLISALVIAFMQYYNARRTQERKQLQLVLVGSVFGLLVPIAFGLNPEYFYSLGRKYYLVSTLEFVNAGGTYIMTSFLAIALFRYRLWNIEPFIRKVILYGTATIVIYLTYSFLIFTVDLLVVEKTRAAHFAILAASIFTFLFLLDSLQRNIDRLFYRESYDSARILNEFEEDVSGVFNQKDLLKRVVEGMERIFHFKTCVLYTKTGPRLYGPIHAYGCNGRVTNAPIPLKPELEKLLSQSKIFSVEELVWKPEAFDHAEGVLVVPLQGDHGFNGFFILGPKRSFKSYSLQDIRILSFLSRRIVTLFHTAQLYQENLDRYEILEQERTRIARDIHDELGANLTRISIMSDIVSKDPDLPGSAVKWLTKISANCRELTREMTQIIWALNPKNDTLSGLLAYIRRFAAEFLEIKNIKCIFAQPQDIPLMKIGVEMRRNIYLIVRESLHNVIKHSLAKNVFISLDLNGEGFNIIIRDDGRGFDQCKLTSPGNGLVNMRKRIKAIGGRTVIKSLVGNGTEVSLMVPVNRSFLT